YSQSIRPVPVAPTVEGSLPSIGAPLQSSVGSRSKPILLVGAGAPGSVSFTPAKLGASSGKVGPFSQLSDRRSWSGPAWLWHCAGCGHSAQEAERFIDPHTPPSNQPP